ncbi:hypothetical protein DFH11DRAFT_1584648 [Phellopilus nigrolimitatus]|nr:hypothetical protein DFH11DRAFT_1584648 [Phellopilus nigrolimitatus]
MKLLVWWPGSIRKASQIRLLSCQCLVAFPHSSDTCSSYLGNMYTQLESPIAFFWLLSLGGGSIYVKKCITCACQCPASASSFFFFFFLFLLSSFSSSPPS